MSLAALFSAERAKRAATATSATTPETKPDPYAALQPDPEALRAAGAKMMAVGPGGDVVPRRFPYEP